MGNKFNPDVKNWKQFQVASHGEAVVRALDELCTKVTDDSNSMMIYWQIIFKDEE